MDFKHSYSLSPGLDLEARRCDDGILVYDDASRTTRLIHPMAWDLFLSISRSELPGNGEADESLLQALASAGLIRRC